MAHHHSPKIVTDGLVLAWDAANPKSYPGSGATIYDLSGNGNNGTLVNTPTFGKSSVADINVLKFTAGSSQWMYSATPDMSFTTSTVIGAARYSTVVNGRTINGYANNWLMGHWDGTTLNYYASGWITSIDNGPADTNWRIYATQNNQPADQYRMYVNGTSEVGPSNAGSQGPSGIAVGRYPAGTEYLTGEFSFVYVYNRILDATELTQVYTAFRTRFGL